MNLQSIVRVGLCPLLLLIAAAAFAQDQRPENLGRNINTKYIDGSPLVSPDGRTIYFVRDDKVDEGKGDYDIWFSEADSNGSWGPAQKIGNELNNDFNNKVMAVTPDGNTLYLAGLYGRQPTDKRGISVVQRTRTGWSKPAELKIKNAPSDWGSFDMSLSSDGRHMILSLNSDLYVSFLGSDGIWSEPRTIGPNINTDGYEYTPFLASDGVTLYFSSNGHFSYGENDIMVTKRLDDTWLKWSEPRNLGRPINSTEWESYFRIPASGDFAYVLSWKGGFGRADIFRVRLRDDQRPNPVVLVRGRVIDARTRKPLEATIRYEQLGTDRRELGTAVTDPRTGEYQIVLPGGNKYGFYAEAANYLPINENLDLSNLTTYREVTKDLRMVMLQQGAVVRLNNIFFETGKWDLQPDSRPELDRVVTLLNSNPSMRIEIAGHTDNVGSAADNVILSRNRAASVREYLVEQGIKPSRLVSKGYGETKPVATNDSDDGRQENRRVEFKVMTK